MEEKPLREMDAQEFANEVKKMRKNEIFHAFSIGLMAGVIIYSIAMNTWGLVTLIPLFFIYRLTRQTERYKELKELVKERKAQ
jgi:hypothetical protein